MIEIGFVHIDMAPIVIPIILPLVVGATILIRFQKDRQKSLLGVFVIKPVVDHLLFWITTTGLLLSFRIASNSPIILQGIQLLVLLLPPLLTTTAILYRFQRLFYKYWLFWLILALDFIRIIFQVFALMLENTKHGGDLIGIWLLSPSLYTLIVLIFFPLWNYIFRKPTYI
ncbi:MAG TPA: hypothetical protein VFZ43_09830 [Anaerolineales bacterium]